MSAENPDRFKVEPELDAIQILDTSTGIVNVLSLAEAIGFCAQLSGAIDAVYANLQPEMSPTVDDPYAAGEGFRP